MSENVACSSYSRSLCPKIALLAISSSIQENIWGILISPMIELITALYFRKKSCTLSRENSLRLKLVAYRRFFLDSFIRVCFYCFFAIIHNLTITN
jgi:hypothetical protein